MPTDDEWWELYQNCTWDDTTQNGVNGRRYTGPNGHSIFLPAAGLRLYNYSSDIGQDGYYWSSSFRMDYPAYALGHNFFPGGLYVTDTNREYGLTIRPVRSARQN